ncbi:hypothetical protein [Novosphingobium huizhouense]|uniref:hypothetical protein n=1 Tax=Novosphingobium huizhouense TaxID=2866625 RepID=UPI001CD893DD|nr:hypothetical protein [Novosphingobium huizhouense]
MAAPAAFVQAGLGLAILVAAIAYPFAGRAALAIPLSAAASREGLPAASTGVAILGRSDVNGLAIVRTPDERAGLAALRRGWLLLAVPSLLCGNRIRTSSVTSRNTSNG